MAILRSAYKWAECTLLTAITQGNPEKLSFRPISSLRNQILSSEYHAYASGKIFLRALILNEIAIFSSSPQAGFTKHR
jgi:hypothetical protein